MASRIRAKRKLIAIGSLIILVITVLFLVLIIMVNDAYENNLFAIEDEIIEKYNQEFQTILYNFQQLSDIYYYEIIDNEDILKIMYKAKYSNNEQQDKLRSQLKILSSEIYKKATKSNIDSVNFVMNDNSSFLTLNDDPSFEYDTVYEKSDNIMQTYNTLSGSTYIYPLEYKGEQIGYIETMVKYSTITNLMSSLYNIESAFIIEKQSVCDEISEQQIKESHTAVSFTDKYYLDNDSVSMSENISLYGENILYDFRKGDFIFDDLDLLSLNETFFMTLSYSDIDFSIVFMWVDNVANENGGYFIFIDEDVSYYSLRLSAITQYTAIVLIWALIVTIIIILLCNRNKIEKISYFDNLTKAYNRNKLFDMIETEMNRDKKNNCNLSILLIDIDKFKHVNDTYGHLVGDKVLENISKLLFQTVRATDLVFRYGGDEFIILLPNTTLDLAKLVAKKINKIVNSTQWQDLDIRVTVSIGVAQYNQSESIDQLISRSDTMLYKAKEQGRNCVVSDS